MKIPLIFQYKTEADHEALKHLKTFLEADGCYVHEVSAHPVYPLWRYISVMLQDGRYSVALPQNVEYTTEPILEYWHDDIIENLEEDDADDEEMIHGEIRKIIVSIAEDYFYPPEVTERLF